MANCAQKLGIDSHPFFDRAFLKRLERDAGAVRIAPFQTPALSHSAALRQWMNRHNHAHPFYEAMIAIRGTCLYGIGSQIFQCTPGTVTLIAPNEPHINRYRPGDNGLRHLWLTFITPKQAFLQDTVVQRGRVRRLNSWRSLMPVDTLAKILHSLKLNDASGSPTADLQRRLLLNAFYAELMAGLIAFGQRPAGAIDREVLVREKIEMMRDHIENTGYFDTSLAELAQLAGYTSSHFARLFKRITGYTVHQHIDACRIEKAKGLLARSLPLKTMAGELGFSDKTTLSRWLKKVRRPVHD